MTFSKEARRVRRLDYELRSTSPQPSHDGQDDNDQPGRPRAEIKEILPVAEIMQRLVAETEAALLRAVDFC
jgi:hypothetical protein